MARRKTRDAKLVEESQYWDGLSIAEIIARSEPTNLVFIDTRSPKRTMAMPSRNPADHATE
jgi:hypothetical protein